MGWWAATGQPPNLSDPGQAHLGYRHRRPPLTLYLDTSALLKLYMNEVGSQLVRARAAEARRMATSALAYVEARWALSRRRRAGDLSLSDYRALLRQIDEDWRRLVTLEVTDVVLGEAVRMAEKHVLRAYDAVHLGSAVTLRSRLGGSIVLASWDDELDAAARREGFLVLRYAAR